MVLQNVLEMDISYENSSYDTFAIRFADNSQKDDLTFTFSEVGDEKILTVPIPYDKSNDFSIYFGKKGNIVKISSIKINGEELSLDDFYNSLYKQHFTVGKSKTGNAVYLKSEGDRLYKFAFSERMTYLSEDDLQQLSDSDKFLSYALFGIIFLSTVLYLILGRKFFRTQTARNTFYYLSCLFILLFLIHAFCMIVGYKFIVGIVEEDDYYLNFLKYESNLIPLLIFIMFPAVLSKLFNNRIIKVLLCAVSFCLIVIIGFDNFASTTFGARLQFNTATGFAVDFKTAIPFFLNYVSTTNGFIAIGSALIFLFFAVGFFSAEIRSKTVAVVYSLICLSSLIPAFWKFPQSDFDIYFANVFQVNNITTAKMGNYQTEFSDDYPYRKNLNYEWKTEPGLNKKQNVIVILVESLTCDLTQMCGDVADKELMPNLAQRASKSLFFDNYYSDSFSTSMAVLSVVKSFPAFPQKSGRDEDYGQNKYVKDLLNQNDLVTAFSREGYRTSFFSSTDLIFMMDKHLELTHFQEIYDSRSDIFNREDQKFIFNSVSDEVLFENILKYVNEHKDGEKLFLMTKTASSHVPFNSPWGSQDFDNSFRYTDYALEKFLNSLEKSNYFDNGIVVITGDHQPWGFVKSRSEDGVYSRNHVPLLVIGGGLENGVNHTMFSHSSLGVYLQSLMLSSYKRNKFNADPVHSVDPALIIAYEFDKQIFAIAKKGDKESRIKFNGDDTAFVNKIFDDGYEHDVLGYLASCSL